MGSYIHDNRSDLECRHYIRKAGTQHYWFDFAFSKVCRFKEQFGHNFCMVIYGSEVTDDAYVLPFKETEYLFKESLLDDRRRWSGGIKRNLLSVGSGSEHTSISKYYNAFELLDQVESAVTSYVSAPTSAYRVEPDVNQSLNGLQARIRKFNNEYNGVAPSKRRIVSDQISRPGVIADALKEMLNYKCQICDENGFMQANGVPYAEAHHITELHKLIPNSYCSDNIIVVCPSCHRKLHYAKVTYRAVDAVSMIAEINGTEYTFARNVLTE